MNNAQASPRLLPSSQAQQQSPAQTSRLRPTIAIENNTSINNNKNNTNSNNGNDDDDNNNAGLITPELLVDALSGHEDGLLTIAERLMTKYDIGYNAMGEAIVDAFADVQRLFQHVVEAAHMEGAALERERGENEWQTRLEELVGDGTMKELDIECALYGGTLGGEDDESTMLDSVRRRRRPRGTDYDDGRGGGDIDDDDDNDERGRGGGGGRSQHHRSSHHQSEDSVSRLRHEELIDQDVRDILIDTLRRGRVHKDAGRHAECRRLYETACSSASALLPVDSDHRGRLQLATARAGGMSDDRACAMLRYAMDDVLRSGLSLRRKSSNSASGNNNNKRGSNGSGVEDPPRGDCVLPKYNPLRVAHNYLSSPTSSTTKNGSSSTNYSVNGGEYDDDGGPTSRIGQSAEEALNSLVEEMKEMLAAPVYDLTPIQDVSEKFWIALSEARRQHAKKEERLEQSLARIKADFLLAREEYEEQLTVERDRTEALQKQLALAVSKEQSKIQVNTSLDSGDGGGVDGFNVYTPTRPNSTSTRSTGSNPISSGMFFLGENLNQSGLTLSGGGRRSGGGNAGSSNQSVVSLGNEFAMRAKSLVHLINCHSSGEQLRRGDVGLMIPGEGRDDVGDSTDVRPKLET
jgi:translation initiation factor 2 alpha subunit (eIF-2alpha)